MGKLKNLDITFEKVPIYPGQIVQGHLEFVAKDSVSIKNIVICFKGTSKTGWGGDGSNGNGSEHLYYRVEQPMKAYLSQNQSSGKTGNKSRLKPGLHKIPFSHVLAMNGIPGSFGGKHGYVYHCCRAVITTAGSSEIRVERPIPVIGKEDLNLHPYAAMPFSAHDSFKQRALCLKMADHSVVIQLPRTGYCPGETVKISGEIVNHSSRSKVRKSSMQLIQSVQYSTSGSKRSKVETSVVAETSWGEVNPNSVLKFEEEQLAIPALPPSFLRGCDEIDIAYELQFTVEPGNQIDIPIIIGTIPYTEQNLKKFVKALPWKTGSDLLSKKQIEAAGHPIPPKIDGKFPFPHFPDPGRMPQPPPRMPPPPPLRPGLIPQGPPPSMGGPRPPPYPGGPQKIGLFRPPGPPHHPPQMRPRPRSGHPPGFPGHPYPRGLARGPGAMPMPGIHVRFSHPQRPSGPLPRGFPHPFPPGMPMPPPPSRKPSAQGPYVTEASDDGESVISKRKESDSARPHGVLKIEEIE